MTALTTRLRILLCALLLLIAAVAFKQYGGSVWRPLLAEAKGEPTVKSVLAEALTAGKGLTEEDLEAAVGLMLIGLKEEQQLEVWLTDEEGSPRLIRSYPFTATSGKLGPKLKEGDLQIPEGIYDIEYLNPQSSYHLSIKLNYPNAFDRARAAEVERTQLGGDIFIHGRAVTIGCIPIGDEAIEDLFAMVAQVGKSKVTTIIAPRDFRVGLEAPKIESVEWEVDLYKIVSEAMEPFVAER